MFATEKVLKRNDAASVVVAIVLAMMVWQFLAAITMPLAAKVVETNPQIISGGGFATEYGMPIVSFILGVAALELFLLLFTGLKSISAPVKAKKKK